VSDELEEQIAEQMGDDQELEPDTATDTEEESEEPETVPEPEPAPDEVDAAAKMKELDKYAERARKYLARNMDEVLGEDATSYLECPFCNFYNTPGFLHASPCPPELLGTVYEWTNTTPPDEYKPDPYSRICDVCDGHGVTATKAKVRGQEALPCIDCGAKGWIPVGPERQGGNLMLSNGPTASAVPPVASSEPMFVSPDNDPPEVVELRNKGYVIIPPMQPA